MMNAMSWIPVALLVFGLVIVVIRLNAWHHEVRSKVSAAETAADDEEYKRTGGL